MVADGAAGADGADGADGPAAQPGVLAMMPPQSMPIGFTYDGDPLYAASPVVAGTRQPLALLPGGEPVWPAPPGLVSAGQPQPFGVLSSGAYVWAVEQSSPATATAWYRRKLLPALAALLAVGIVAVIYVAGGSDEQAAQQAVQQAAQPAADDRGTAGGAGAEQQEPADRGVADPPPAAVDFVMPDFTGEKLQVAQNRVQELGVFLSVSHDLRGSRSQVLDGNWQVCSQMPAPAARVTGAAGDWEGQIDFGVVKLTESCP